MNSYCIDSSSWEVIYKVLQKIPGLHVKNEDRLRCFLQAVFFVLRTGIQWQGLPSDYGNSRSIHKKFLRWCERGIFDRILQEISKDYDGETVMIDATITRTHACATGYRKGGNQTEAIGRSAGGLTTKIHACVDALGQPLRFVLTPGQTHDVTQAEALIEGIENAHVIADKAYDANALIQKIQAQNCIPVIPTKVNRINPREYDAHIYKERHLIECFFSKIKHFRRVFCRYDKRAIAFMGFLNLAASIIWLR